jgi:GDSL-like Lipase/Acylhydrolase family
MRRVLIGAFAVLALAAAACTSINPTTTASGNDRDPPYVYVAIGESGADGSRGGPPDLRSQWTQMFYRSTLGTDAVLYDLTSGGQTVAEVLSSVLPQALAVHPELATVWLSTADIVAGTALPVYEQELKQLVEALRHAGATVLLANAAPPEVFPALESCGSGASVCDSQGGPNLSSPALASTVSAYDSVIASVGRQTGADIVDVHSVLAMAIQDGGAERVLSPQGTALSESVATIVAHAFDTELPRRFLKHK